MNFNISIGLRCEKAYNIDLSVNRSFESTTQLDIKRSRLRRLCVSIDIDVQCVVYTTNYFYVVYMLAVTATSPVMWTFSYVLYTTNDFEIVYHQCEGP